MGNLSGMIETFGRYKYLLRYLVKRDITVKYRRSVLGIVWSVLNPLLMMLIMTAVFQFIFEQQIDYFPVYLISGQLMFNFFSEATSSAMDSVLNSAALLKKVYIPKYIFPLEKVIFSFVNALFSLVALLVVMLFVQPPITWWILLFPVPMILLFFFSLGVGLILASLVVFFRDVKHLYGVLITALMYMTPIFYPVTLLSGVMQKVLYINPLYWYVSMFRNVVLYGVPPTGLQLLAGSAFGVVALLFGILIMKKTQDRFILYI